MHIWLFGGWGTAWNKIKGRKGFFSDVVYDGSDQFYAISSTGVIWGINLAAGHRVCRQLGLGVYVGQGQYILKTINGSVLGMKKSRDKNYYLTREVRAYDIDMETGSWKEIYSLGSMAVFLGCNSSFAVDATAPNERGGVFKANHIYFTDDFGIYQNAYFTNSNWKRSYANGSRYAKGGSVDSGIYNFETGMLSQSIQWSRCLRNVCPAMWITPNLCFQ